MISPEFVHASRTLFEHNLNTHTPFAKEKKLPYAARVGAATSSEESQESAGSTIDIQQYQVGENGNVVGYSYQLGKMEQPFVNVMPVDGPITRNGGACSYGSVELRDWLIRAANDQMCRGHVFYVDTPGGSAWAKNDFQQAIDYAHSMNQKVLAFIDGQCASAGMYLASLCDEVYYMHPKNQIGCIGVMAAFYTEKPDTTNRFTNETYREYYDPESYEKNQWYREIEKDGNATLLIEELKELGVEFRADVQKAFPAATDEYIHGKIFDAEKVVGILCDGQSTFGEVVARAFALYDGAEPVKRKEATPSASSEGPSDGDASEGNATVPAASAEGSKENNQNSNNPQNQENMKKYESIAAACGVDELVVTEEGSHFVPEMLDQLEASLATASTEKQNAEKRADDLQAKLDAAATEQTEAVNNKEKELNEAHETVVNNLNTEKAQLEKDLADARKAKEDAEKALETANQTIKDQTAQIESLTTAAAAMHDEGAKNNGQGAAAEEPKCAMPEYDHTKSPLENARIRKAAGF